MSGQVAYAYGSLGESPCHTDREGTPDMHQPDPDQIHITVLRGECGDDKTCPAITDLGDPDYLYFIAEPVTDPNIVSAHAARMAPHERLYRFPRHLIPEVSA